jgi:hypothetical protein
MRAVKNNLPAPSGEWGDEKALALDKSASRRARGWAGKKVAHSWRLIGPPFNRKMKDKAAGLPDWRHPLFRLAPT